MEELNKLLFKNFKRKIDSLKGRNREKKFDHRRRMKLKTIRERILFIYLFIFQNCNWVHQNNFAASGGSDCLVDDLK